MPVRVIVGFDGSPAAAAAVEVGAQLLPHSRAWMTYVRTPPFASSELRRRLRTSAADVNDLMEMTEREGNREAELVTARGVTQAQFLGWDAESLIKRTYSATGKCLNQLAEEFQADVVLVGSRGLRGTQAALDSVSAVVVHSATRPVLWVPYPMLSAERGAVAAGPALVCSDGTAEAESAISASERLLWHREIVLMPVEERADLAPPDKLQGRQLLRLPAIRRRRLQSHAVANRLVLAARKRNAAVVVVGLGRASSSLDSLLGSVAAATLSHSHVPILVVPAARGR